MSAFFDISAPPQSLDALDGWGGLDALPVSLDSAFWNWVSLYGLRIDEAARTSVSLRGACVSCLAGQGKARSSDALALLLLYCGWQRRGGAGPQAWMPEAPAQGLWQSPSDAGQAWKAQAQTRGLWRLTEPQRRTAWL